MKNFFGLNDPILQITRNNKEKKKIEKSSKISNFLKNLKNWQFFQNLRFIYVSNILPDIRFDCICYNIFVQGAFLFPCEISHESVGRARNKSSSRAYRELNRKQKFYILPKMIKNSLSFAE